MTKHPILGREEERDLLERHHAGERRASDRLVLCNQRLVVSLAMRWARRGISLEDLVQEGNVGLLVALQRFDLGRGVRFVTYAALWVRAMLGLYAIKQPSVVRANIREKRWPVQDVSLDEQLRDRDETRLDMLVDDRPGPEDVAVERESVAAARVMRLMSGLNGRERDVVRRRVLDDDRETLREIGESYDLSRERVRQIEKNAMAKLKRRLVA